MSIFDKIKRFLSDDDHQDPQNDTSPKHDDETMVTETPPPADGGSSNSLSSMDKDVPDLTDVQIEMSDAEIEKMLTDQRLKAEYRMSSDQSMRAVAHRTLTLGEYLKKKHHISANDITAMHVVVNDPTGKTIIKIERPADYDLLQDIMPTNPKDTIDGGRCIDVRRNVTLDISLGGLAILRGISHMIINMNGKGEGGEYSFVLVKMSYLVREGSGIQRGVHYFTYDHHFPERLNEMVRSKAAAAADKNRRGQPLSDSDRLILDSPRLPGEMRRAEDMMRQQRWTDAITVLAKVYDIQRRLLLHRDNQSLRDMMLQTVMALYKCHISLGQYDTALYYGELSAWLEGHPNRLFLEALRKTGDIRILAFPQQAQTDDLRHNEDTGPKGRKRFSFVLETVCGLQPTDLSDMLMVRDGNIEQSETVSGPAEIWAFDMLAQMKDCDSLTAYITLRSSRTMSDGGSNDKSTDTADNVVIAVFTKETASSRPCIRMSLIIPETVRADGHSPETVRGVDLQFMTEKALDMPLFLDISEEAAKKASNNEPLSDIEYMAYGSLTEARYNMVLGSNAIKRHVWGDALYYLTKAYRLMAWSALLGAPDTNAEDAIYNLCYMIGFAYCELKLYHHAISYLSRIAHVPYPRYQIEYINALCNSNDVRALDVISDRMTNYPDKMANLPPAQFNEFMRFLKRRYGYALIESGRIKEAKEHLRKLATDDDEETRNFAINELKYIDNKYPDNGDA